MYRHPSGKVENVYIILPWIYSGNDLPNFTRIAWASQKILQKKHYGLFFPDTLYVPIVQKYQNGLATKSVSMIVSSFLARLYYV